MLFFNDHLHPKSYIIMKQNIVMNTLFIYFNLHFEFIIICIIYENVNINILQFNFVSYKY